MVWGGNSYRDVRFQPTWEADVERLRSGQAPPAPVDEVLEEFDWTIARIGDQYPEIEGTGLRVMEIPPARGLPRLNAWFRIGDDGIVCAESVEEVASEEEEDQEAGPELDGWGDSASK